MKMCMNKKTMAVVAAAGAGVLLLFPSALSVVPLVLCMGACPLAMVLLMRAMPKGDGSPSTPSGDGQRQSEAMDELAALRAEAQHLRTRRARDHRVTTTPTD